VINRRQDYIVWMIEQTVQAMAEAARLMKAGKFDLALIAIRRASDLVVPPPMRALFDRLEPASAVSVLGPAELDRVRLYAALLGEEGAVHELRGHAAEARLCYTRSLELYEAAKGAGAELLEADRERISDLRSKLAEA
jgi:hypothetical protein